MKLVLKTIDITLSRTAIGIYRVGSCIEKFAFFIARFNLDLQLKAEANKNDEHHS